MLQLGGVCVCGGGGGGGGVPKVSAGREEPYLQKRGP